MRHPTEVSAMEVHRFLGGIEHVLFSPRSDVFFEYVNKHIRVFHISLAVHSKIRHLLILKVEIPLPDLIQPSTIAPTYVAQEPIITGPFRYARSSNGFLPWPITRDPEPAVDRSLCRRQCIGLENVIDAESKLFSLPKNKIQMTGLRMLIFDQFFVLVLHDPLLNLELRTVRGHLWPKVSSLADVNAQLQQINPRPLGRHLDRVKVLHLRRKKQISHTITQFLSPFLWLHELPPRSASHMM